METYNINKDHLKRMEDARLPKMMLLYNPGWRRNVK
jgi:hypothetical protein